MVHYSKVINGLSVFIDRELTLKMQGTMKGWIFGSLADYALNNKPESVYRAFEAIPMVKAIGIIDGDFMDVDGYIEKLRKQAQRGDAKLSIPFFGDVNFSTADVENLYRYIKEA